MKKKLGLNLFDAKNKILLGSTIASVFFCSNLLPAHALELDEDTRTVTLDSKGNSVILTPEQVKEENDYLTMLVEHAMLVV